jgi:hypothetical protein
MRIQHPVNHDPINQPKRQATTMPLKPLDSSDFARQLKTATGDGGDAATEPTRAPLRPLSPMEMIPGVKGPVRPLEPLNPPPAPLLPLGDGSTAFYPGGSSRPPKSEHDKIQEQARKWVSQTFYGTLLKQMRDSPFKSELFSGGRGGQAFTPMLDQHLADRMARSSDSKLVKAIARKLEARTSREPQQQPPVPASKQPKPSSDNPYQNVRIHVAPSPRA